MTTPDDTGVVAETRHVSREDIRRFAVATGAESARHHDSDAARAEGYRDVVAPPGFFVSLGLSLNRVRPRSELSDNGLPLLDALAGKRAVAGETSVEWFGDIVAGDDIDIVQRLLGVTERSGRSGPLRLYEYERTYSRGTELLVRERYVRIARQ